MRFSGARQLKSWLLRKSILQDTWGIYRRWQLHREYASRREYYVNIARERGQVYNEDRMVAAIRARLAQRGYSPVLRRMGEIHTFAFIPRIGWHPALIPDLRQLGPVTEFDYVAHGFRPEEFQRCDTRAAQRRRETGPPLPAPWAQKIRFSTARARP